VTPRAPLPTLVVAAALALGSAISLGLARFAYALLLPTMRADLGWSYFTGGAMNTVNAAGYLIGALLRRPAPALWRAPVWSRRPRRPRSPWQRTAPSRATRRSHAALSLRRGRASLVAGAVLARASAAPPGAAWRRAVGPALGLYGGTGIDIVAAALLVPSWSRGGGTHAWQPAWIGLGAIALAATALLRWRRGPAPSSTVAGTAALGRFRWRPFVPGLVAYLLFGLGYIGYMTFVITMLRDQQLAPVVITSFYAMLGVAVIASSWLWAGMLQRFRGGESLAILSALLAIATLLPVVSARPLAVFASGLLFGAVFLSLVTSTTALIRHNLAPALWAAGIGAFTIMFAAGQIVGPALVGFVADRSGGLRAGLACSAAVLALGALVAWRQKPLPPGL
jgi:predicted MFS family arabinose efflux permease